MTPPGTAIRLAGRPGMAYRVIGQATYVDDDGHDVEHDWLLVRAVGDDYAFEVDPDDVLPLSQPFCGTCGQVGCGWHEVA